MTDERRYLKNVCEELGGRFLSDEKFQGVLDAVVEGFKLMAAEGKYSIVAYAHQILDESIKKGHVTSDRVLAISKVLPISLSACYMNVPDDDPELAYALAMNILKHEDFYGDQDTRIDEAIIHFIEQGYADAAVILIEGLMTVSYGYTSFNHRAFLCVLGMAFEEDDKTIIEWTKNKEEYILSTDIRYSMDETGSQWLGNLLYKKGVKKLGTIIMEKCPGSSRGLELFERELFTGRGVEPSNPLTKDHDAIVAYMLGTPMLSREWFSIPIVNISGDLLSRNIKELSDIGVQVSNDRIELVSAIMIATSTKIECIKSVNDNLRQLGVVPAKELVDIAYNQAMPKSWYGIQSLVLFNKIATEQGADVDYGVAQDRIDKEVSVWQQGYTSHTDMVTLMYDSPNFPITDVQFAEAIDLKWSKWNPKDRDHLFVNTPKRIAAMSRQLKGVALEQAIGL
jgi:hypothetical protein